MDKVNSLLLPFISKHRSKLTTSGMVITDEPQPISLNTLTGMGGLDESKGGYSQLKNLANMITQESSRPLGGFSVDLYVDGPAAEAQRLLRLHGPALVRADL